MAGKLVIGSVIGIVLTVIIVLSFMSGSTTTISDSADSITDANNCSQFTDSTGTAMTFNTTNRVCVNSTGNETNNVAGGIIKALPLNGLFASSGVALLVLMASIMIGLAVYVIRRQ